MDKSDLLRSQMSNINNPAKCQANLVCMNISKMKIFDKSYKESFE